MARDDSGAIPPFRWTEEPLRGSPAERKAALLFRAALREQGRRRPDLAAVRTRLRDSWAGRAPLAARARGDVRGDLRFGGPRRVRGRAAAFAFAAAVLVAVLSLVATAAWRRYAAEQSQRGRGETRSGPGDGARARLGAPAPRAVGDARVPAATVPPPIAGESAAGADRRAPIVAAAPRPPVRPARRARVVALASPADRLVAAASAGAAAGPQVPVEARPAETAVAADAAQDDSALQASILAQGLSLLRRRHDSAGAIAVFQGYHARFPHGLFHEEVGSALVEALMAAGRTADALAALDATPVRSGERGRARTALRGELRGHLGRCVEAIQDFDAVLAVPGADDVAERALFGRATCHARLGRAAEARDDFEAYARRFPDGRFSAAARKLLRP